MSTVEWNGSEYDEEAFRAASRLVVNGTPTMRTDGEVVQALGKQYGGDRDIYDVLGYEKDLETEDYRARIERQDIADRVLRLPPNDTWRHRPRLLVDGEETSFTDEVRRLADETNLYDYLRRADVATGLGEYGVLFIGLRDNQPLDEPVNEGAVSDVDDVAFFTPFAQDSVEDWRLGKDVDRDPTDPLYNMPVEYELDFGDIDDDSTEDLHWVHHERVIHIVENNIESELKGAPRLRAIFNRLVDREKVLGSSAEMFWTGAAPKYQFDIDADNTADIPSHELDDLDSQVQALVHDMEQYIKTFNTDIEVIDGQEVDPSGIIDQIDTSIASQTGIPKRILTGSEQAELASTQDRANWYGRVQRRRERYAEPEIVRPVIDTLQSFGILPEADGRYSIDWPNLFELNELERSEIINNRANAVESMREEGGRLASPEELFDFVVDGVKPDFD